LGLLASGCGWRIKSLHRRQDRGRRRSSGHGGRGSGRSRGRGRCNGRNRIGPRRTGFAGGRLDLGGLGLGFGGLWLGRRLGALIALGGLLRRLGNRLGARRLLGAALLALVLLALVDRGLHPLLGPHHIGGFAGSRRARRLLGALIRRRTRRFLGALLRAVLALLGVLALVARVRRAIGDEVGRQHGGHVAAGGVVLAQEARQRRGRNAAQQAARRLVTGIAGARKDLGGGLAGLEVLDRVHRHRHQPADQKR